MFISAHLSTIGMAKGQILVFITHA
uniref:Uncharacterized protein n=1 Tax=Rhizophora mucronata TaxID=61149 RepID=A0A2P2PF30_RHIMU